MSIYLLSVIALSSSIGICVISMLFGASWSHKTDTIMFRLATGIFGVGVICLTFKIIFGGV